MPIGDTVTGPGRDRKLAIGLLGSLAVGTPSPCEVPKAAKVRTVLAMLVVNADRLVTVSALTRELWGGNQPGCGSATVQTYVFNLRQYLASVTGLSRELVARDILVTVSGGYQLRSELLRLDFLDYQRLVGLSRNALASGDDRLTIRFLDEALALWRGDALVDVAVGTVLEARRRQYEESRLIAVEYRAETQLRLGLHREATAELAGLTVSNPLHEGLHSLYMRALYLSGRRAQALQVFRVLRSKLVTAVGIEPGPPLQRLQHAILAADPGLERALRFTDDEVRLGHR